MSLPIDISFQGVPHSKSVEDAVVKRAHRLAHIRHDITRCRVSLTLGAKHQHQGKPIDVHVIVTTPHQTHISSKTSNEDAYLALDEAFTHIERMLVDTEQKHRPHAGQPSCRTEEA
ncbi:HPF/RaiA family ribosome-associated protein [Ralstonia sp. ASV6]|uniref:HPF/RaiA family ribosome-associated protein n=1 Tax=Ralstonia sp. ASV6 TaxID=2795124 RepID=UPI0018EB9B5C